MAQNKSLSTQEVADILHVSKSTIYDLIRRGEIHSYSGAVLGSVFGSVPGAALGCVAGVVLTAVFSKPQEVHFPPTISWASFVSASTVLHTEQMRQ